MPIQRQAPLEPGKTRPPVKPTSQADFFEMLAQASGTDLVQRRRKMKFRRFIFFESLAVGTLLPLAIIGLLANVTSPLLLWTMNIVTIAAAISAAAIPIAFYAFTPTLPEIER